jgi:hypothetical protein
MAANLKIYDSDQVSVSFSGIPINSGRADGEFVRIEQVADDFTYKVGVDGQVTRSKTKNRVTKVTLLLMQSSDSNIILSAINTIDVEAANGAGVGAMLIRDMGGTSLFAAAEAWIIKPPDANYGAEASLREWVFNAARPKRIDGGN